MFLTILCISNEPYMFMIKMKENKEHNDLKLNSTTRYKLWLVSKHYRPKN